MNMRERAVLLSDVLVESFDMTIRGLIAEDSVISGDTFEARNFLIAERESMLR